MLFYIPNQYIKIYYSNIHTNIYYEDANDNNNVYDNLYNVYELDDILVVLVCDNDDDGNLVGEWLFSKNGNNVSLNFEDAFLKGANESRNAFISMCYYMTLSHNNYTGGVLNMNPNISPDIVIANHNSDGENDYFKMHRGVDDYTITLKKKMLYRPNINEPYVFKDVNDTVLFEGINNKSVNFYFAEYVESKNAGDAKELLANSIEISTSFNEYTLLDSLENYDFAIVTIKTTSSDQVGTFIIYNNGWFQGSCFQSTGVYTTCEIKTNNNKISAKRDNMTGWTGVISILSIKGFKIGSDSDSGNNDEYVLFDNGKFMNQGIATLVYNDIPNYYEVTNERINIFANDTGSPDYQAGLRIIDVDHTKIDHYYQVKIEFEAIETNINLQSGRCYNNATFPGITAYGTNRITYNTDNGIPMTIPYIMNLYTGTGTQNEALFVGIISSTGKMSIKKVTIMNIPRVISH